MFEKHGTTIIVTALAFIVGSLLTNWIQDKIDENKVVAQVGDQG